LVSPSNDCDSVSFRHQILLGFWICFWVIGCGDLRRERLVGVCNAGRERGFVSIFDLVAGDIVPLSLGGQVCPFGWMAFELSW
jgi:hypothetical protein